MAGGVVRAAGCVKFARSAKEMSIAHLVASGMSDKEVAVELNIAPATVAVHNKKIFKKLGIHSRTELKTLTAQKN